MKVTCRREKLTADELDSLGLAPWPQHYGLEQGREYLVLAIYAFVKSVWGRGPVVQIAAPPDPLPTYAPMCLFAVSDPRLSRFWTVEAWDGALAIGPTLLLAAHFMEDLADDVPEVRNQFDELYALMLAESATT
jgi:hypothetical protein